MKVQYLDETYENLTALGTDADNVQKSKAAVYLVRNRQTGKIYVKKYIDRQLIAVYEKLKTIEDCHLEKIYDCAADEKMGIVILEYISGRTLQEYMEEKGKVSEQEAGNIIEELLKVLKKVHGVGIVHRDINPNNIMLSNDGVLKLIDFNIARQKKAEQSKDTTILGTVGYAAPEQFGFTQTDERTDIYAVGILWNVLLTGCLPTDEKYAVSPVKELIQRCTEIDGRLRFENAEELLKAMKKKENFRIFSWLPGFRTGMVWKKVVATIGYTLMILYSVISIKECAGSLQTCVLEIIAVLLYIWSATLVAANIGKWDRRLFFKKVPKPVMVVIRVLLWVFLFYYGVLLENYVRYDLMGIPRK